jgi:hypothetical protein
MRNEASFVAVIETNAFSGVSDFASSANPAANRPQGLLEPVCFFLGIHGKYTVKR